jgi:DNA-binding NarL/FixJ family response regulator
LNKLKDKAVDKLRILLADDHAVVREGLKSLINAQPDMEVVGEASNGLEVAEQVRGCYPNLVIMDISMPELNGAQATAQLIQDCPDIKVLALSVHEDASYLRQLLEAGVVGYVLKRSAADMLIQALRMVAAGGVYLDPLIASKVVGSLVGKTTVLGAPATAELSEREADVIRLIAQGYSNKEIAAQLGLSIKTVETYKSRAMEKLGLDSRVAIVRYALQRGWLQEL